MRKLFVRLSLQWKLLFSQGGFTDALAVVALAKVALAIVADDRLWP